MAYGESRQGERLVAAALSAAAVAALGYALTSGFTVSLPTTLREPLRLFTITPPAPPPPAPKPPPPPHRRTAEREGASAPPNLQSRATPVVAPPPIVPPVQPPPIAVAPLPATGLDSTSGASLVAGPGTGAGGVGNGTGSGRSGNGAGAGGTPARVISRPLRFGDLPAAVVRTALAGEARLEVEARYTVTAEGRVTNCRVVGSSGHPALDAATCQAMTAKLRYRPERDAAGRPVAIETEGYQTWESVGGYAPGG